MALLSFVDSTPRAYRLKASNAAPPISTFPGAIPTITSLSAKSSHAGRRYSAEEFNKTELHVDSFARPRLS
jgi:hypothetical protein